MKKVILTHARATSFCQSLKRNQCPRPFLGCGEPWSEGALWELAPPPFLSKGPDRANCVQRAPRTGSCFWKSEGLGSSWAVSLQHKTVNPLTVDTAPCCSLADHRTCPWITRQRRKSILCPPPFHSETKCLAWIRLLPLLQKINYCKKYWVNLRNTVNFQFRLKLP